jgi:UDP-N-acetylglucosamine--N-acetylmuramyl-(pentapeptide) pyrophosphoryl-undecaprenol N-acetylglucosamine transferase
LSERVEVVLATSHGGHVEELLAVESAWAGRSCAWVMPPGRQADDLRAAGVRVEHVVNPHRNPFRLALNLLRSARALLLLRPRVVVSGGANAAVAFCALARVFGARVLFFETVPRVRALSLSGRMMYRVAHAFLVQWPDVAASYPRAEVCRPALFERVGGRVSDGEGTFVAAGTHGQGFGRLVDLVDEGERRGLLPSPVVRQLSPTMTAEEFRGHIASSRVVISHGGAGTVSLALAHGRKPLVLPRRREHGEHVDDHQVEMTDKLDELGMVVSLDRHGLEEAVELAARAPRPLDAPGPRLDQRLRELVDAALADI